MSLTMPTAMILAAGKGQRMQPLTDTTPKPLLKVAGKPLIVYHLEKLASLGVKRVVINHAHLGEQFPAALGDGSKWGLTIVYSPEPPGGLETAGGIIQALPLLGAEPFWVINGDIFTYMPFEQLPMQLHNGNLAELVLTNNPQHNPHGDFAIEQGRVVSASQQPKFTFTGMGLYHPNLFSNYEPTAAPVLPLRPLFEQAITRQQLGGVIWAGAWIDVGTPERLQQLDSQMRSQDV
ncbi:MAG: nucleotidyltransferase family protein [Idiomarina sp.]